MPSPLKTFPKYLLAFALLFCLKPAEAQNKYKAITFSIDSLANIGLPKSALAKVDELDNLARKNNNAPQQVRAVIYRMTFQSYLEENALVAIITRLKQDIDKADYPVKPVLQSLLAQMYWNYYQQNQYQFLNRTKMEKTDPDFTRWDLQTVINETSRLYEASLKASVPEQETPISVFDGVLDGDKSTRYLRPTLYDLLVQRALVFYLSDIPAINKPKLPFSVNDPRFFSDSKTFAGLSVKTSDSTSAWYKGIRYLQQVTAFHLEKNQQEALGDVDMQRLKFLLNKSTAPHVDSLYLAALQKIVVAFADKPISTDALVLQGQYYQGKDSLIIAYGFFKKAVAAFPESIGGKNAAGIIKQIESKELQATLENINMPGKPILALLEYRNLVSVKYIVYRLTENQLKGFNSFSTQYSYTEQGKYQLTYLQNFTPVQTNQFKWSNIGDYRKHSLEFKIDALLPGNYVLVAKDGNSDDLTLTGITRFKVSAIAYTLRRNPDNDVEVAVTDRETGAPIGGVKIQLDGKYYQYNTKTSVSKYVDTVISGNSNRDGLFTAYDCPANIDFTPTLKIKGDTLIGGLTNTYGALENTDETPDDKTVIFTDRQIYRPGQTLYFKAVQLQVLKGKSTIMPGKDMEVEFMDANYKQVTSLKLKTNEFGTVSGSFIIPQNMLNGQIQLKTADGSIGVQVEEYKRPTFQVTFLPVKESYKLNDSVTVKGTVTAFSGYGLSQAKVAYHITRTQNQSFGNSYTIRGAYRPYPNNGETEIKTDTTTTDDQGNFTLSFKAIQDEASKNNNAIYNYAIKVDVTDASGETHSGEQSVVVGNNDIAIHNYFPLQILAKDSISFPVNVVNLNQQPQKGEISVDVYALKNAGQVFKNRLWTKPNQQLLSKDDFKKDFRDYAYHDEDEVANWATLKKVDSLKLQLDGEKDGVIKLNAFTKQPSGVYRVVIRARNQKGDTVSTTNYVTLVNSPSKPSKFADWVVPVLNQVKVGDTAEYLVGIDDKINVLMERYRGAKLLSAKWLVIDKGQQSIKIPVTEADKDAAVQFMMVYHNRFYSSYQKIFVVNPDKSLQVKFLTYRNKLQPGEKEQWKIQVSGQHNEKYAAEMLASLYDASLDDITPAADWQHSLNDEPEYDPNYFAWTNFNFVQATQTIPVLNAPYNLSLLSYDYERLNLFGYDYYGGYNGGYRDYLNKINRDTRSDKQIAADYEKNALKVKNGYDISGTVVAIDDGLAMPGVVVTVNGTQLKTATNSKGYFKIRVPKNSKLVFNFIGYKPKSIATTKAEDITVKLAVAANQLGEVVVTGALGIKRQAKELGYSSSSVYIRGVSSATAKDLSEPGQLLQGQAAGVYGMSAPSPVVMREIRVGAGDKFYKSERKMDISAPPITIRKNFNETAFFYPQLHTNEKGEILIDFTIPEALTRWKFRGLAHTADLKIGYIESTVVTQKQLSISANMPRFLREGDTVTVSVRLANLTSDPLKGEVKMQLFNALNMQPVNLFVNNSNAGQSFEVAGNTNKAVSFRLVIPAGLDALTYRLTADAGQYTDGEENTLPVLPNRMLVTESMPMMVRAGQTRSFTFDKLVNQNSPTLKNKTLTLEYTQNPAWYAVQALPYLMEFPYECSEQTFSRYFANSLATNIVTKLPAIKQVFDQWKSASSSELLSNLERNQELKATLIEETPWLKDAQNETEQKKRIALLFDMNKMGDELKQNLDKLQKKQLPDGGFPWFGGERSDRYITQHIIEGIGELYHVGITDNKATLDQVVTSAIKYQDAKLLEDDKYQVMHYKVHQFDDIAVQAWFARSYFLDAPMSSDLKKLQNEYLKWAADQWKYRNAYEQGMIALTMQRYKKPEVTQQIERSLMETAQQSDELGMYWAKNQLGYFWYQSPIETQSLLIELFTEAGDNTKAVDEMKVWLLRNKQTNDWKTTKATAAACYALLLKGSNLLADTGSSIIKLDGKRLEDIKPDVKADAGTGYLKTSWADEQIKPQLGKVEIKNSSKTISWGAMHWQYLENLDKITSSQTNIHLERKYFIQKQTDAGAVLTAVDATHQPKTGDLLKVVVYLKADRDFEYVQLKDMRPAGTEPVDAISTYKYQDGLYYYQVTKDVATNFFISELTKGNYVFEYRLRVAQPGNFSTGITSIQCMYAPEFNAHSQGSRMAIKP